MINPYKIIDPIEVNAIDLAVHIYNSQTIKWIKELKQAKSFKTYTNLSPIDNRLRRLMEKVFSLVYLTGFDSVHNFVRKYDDTSIMMGFDDAIWKLLSKNVISAAQYKAAAASIKAITFSVQRIERADVLLKVKESILEAIEKGTNFEVWKDDLSDIFKTAGVTPLDPWHIETVFRTNISSLYNLSRWEAGDADDNVVGWQFFGIEDDRQSDTCAEISARLGDSVIAKDDPILNTITPPNHYNCRSTLIPVTRGYMEDTRSKFNEEIDPDLADLVQEDFRSSPRSLGDYVSMTESLLNESEKQLFDIDEQIRNS